MLPLHAPAPTANPVQKQDAWRTARDLVLLETMGHPPALPAALKLTANLQTKVSLAAPSTPRQPASARAAISAEYLPHNFFYKEFQSANSPIESTLSKLISFFLLRSLADG